MSTAATEVTGTRQAVYSPNLMADLVVAQCGWTREAEAEFGIEAICAGEVPVDRYWIATQDGRGYVAEWHTGASEDAVYVERWEAEKGGVTFHGWIDVTTRKIVQAG